MELEDIIVCLDFAGSLFKKGAKSVGTKEEKELKMVLYEKGLNYTNGHLKTVKCNLKTRWKDYYRDYFR